MTTLKYNILVTHWRLFKNVDFFPSISRIFIFPLILIWIIISIHFIILLIFRIHFSPPNPQNWYMSHTDFCHNCLYFSWLSTIFCLSIPLFDQSDDYDVLRINLTERNMQIFRYFRHFRKTSVCDIFSFWRFFEETSVYHRKNHFWYV